MNKEQSEIWIEEITNLLDGKKLITISVTPLGIRVEQNQRLNSVSSVDYGDGNYSILISDSYGVISGLKDIHIKPEDRGIYAKIENGYGELCQFAWIIQGKDFSGRTFRQMRKAQDRIWKVY